VSGTIRVELAPVGVTAEVERGAALSGILAEQGVEFPCGGAESCGGCRVRVLSGTLPPTADDCRTLSDAEIGAGWRLGCRARACEDVVLEVEQWSATILSDSTPIAWPRGEGVGIAVDLGTTTLVVQSVDLSTGRVLGLRTGLNPQCARGADVMSRIRFALTDGSLTPLIRDRLGTMVQETAGGRAGEVRDVVLVGNTVMHHLFCGLPVEALAHVPFESPHPEEREFAPAALGWPLPSSCRIRFLPCIGGFVGSDTLAGIAATGIAEGDELTALVDLGTNGEIALGNRERILCASTAAGPAFEACSIRMGMRAATGAISRVTVCDRAFRCEVIGDVAPRGICGSGVVDAMAAGLDLGLILPNGRIADNLPEIAVAAPVTLCRADIRELQLAKAAVASGVRILLKRIGAAVGDVRRLYLAGAFGNYVRIDSAARIGLLEAPAAIVAPAGNTALRGAKIALVRSLLPNGTRIEHVPLAADPAFQDTFVDCLAMPDRSRAAYSRKAWTLAGGVSGGSSQPAPRM